MPTPAQARHSVIWRNTAYVQRTARAVELRASRHTRTTHTLQKEGTMSYQLSPEEVRAIVRKSVLKGYRKALAKAQKAQRANFAKNAAVDRIRDDMRSEVERLRQKAALIALRERFAKSTDPEEKQRLSDLGQALTFRALKDAHREGRI
jgi:alpha-ketoglutarate-dependent taurine dioxygenase